jgi:hypothetical protein
VTISEKKKASNYKWDRENMTTLGCRVRRYYAERIKAAAAAAGTTPSAIMRRALDEFMQDK